MDSPYVTIIGAGLAGSEAALQLANHGKKVVLYDQKPTRQVSPYYMSTYAELVCNNSFGLRSTSNPLGLLLSELKILGSRLISIAEQATVCDKRYFAINKKVFSELVTSEIKQNKNITIHNKYCTSIPEGDVLIIASGPITNAELLNDISIRYGLKDYHFADSSCAVVDINSIDLTAPEIVKISNDLYVVNIPDKNFCQFAQVLSDSHKHSKQKHNTGKKFLECHSIEELAAYDVNNLLSTRFSHAGFPKGCLLLRREGALENGYIMVGCMTTLPHKEQLRAFSLLPGFSNVRLIKYGRMHQNTFFESPGHLNSFYKLKSHPVYIIGQLSGIDGYAPAISSGFVAAHSILFGDNLPIFPRESMIGGLANYVSNECVQDFQPMCASFSLIPEMDMLNNSPDPLSAIYNYAKDLRHLYNNCNTNK